MECQYTPLLSNESTNHLQYYGSVPCKSDSDIYNANDTFIQLNTSSDDTGNIHDAITSLFCERSIWNPTLQAESEHLKFIFNVLRGHLPTLSEIRALNSLITSVLCKQDPVLFAEVRALLQELLIDMCQQLCTQTLSDADNFRMEMIIGDILCLLPFLRPEDKELFQAPIKTEDGWQLIPYTIDRIEMTPAWMGSPLVAFGLRSEIPKAPPKMLLKGTTYPSDEGACLSVLTDLNPFAAVGCYAFFIGKEKIQAWLEAHASITKAIIYGKSLGGAQAWRSAINFPEYIAKVMAYGAPGFSPWEQDQIHQVTDEVPDLQIFFFCQKNDLVPYSDWVADRGVRYYEVLSSKDQENPLLAHAVMTSIHENSEMHELDPEVIGNPCKRAAVTIARLFASAFFPFILIGHAIKTSIDHIYTGCLLLGGCCNHKRSPEVHII